MANVSPLPKKKEVPKETPKLEVSTNKIAYQLELRFNEKAELINVTYPENMSLEMINNHVAVGMLYLAQRLVAEAEGRNKQ